VGLIIKHLQAQFNPFLPLHPAIAPRNEELQLPFPTQIAAKTFVFERIISTRISKRIHNA
jgi:hypothetical protein